MWRASGSLKFYPQTNVPKVVKTRLPILSSATPTPRYESSREESTTPPPSSGGGGAGKAFFSLLGITVVVGGGLVGYAWYDSKFRKNLEDYVPLVKTPLDTIFKYLPPPASEPTPVKPVPAPAKVVEKKLEEPPAKPKQKPAEKSSPAPAAAEPAVSPAELKQRAAEAAKKEAEDRKRREKEKAEEMLREEEKKVLQANSELEYIIEKQMTVMSSAVAQALSDLKTATEAVRQHTKQLKQAMEAGRESEWASATGTHQARTDAVWASDASVDKAKMAIEKLKVTITDGRGDKNTKKNKALNTAESELNKLNSNMSLAIAELNKAQSSAKIMSEYRELVLKGKEQFQKEIESILPDVKPGEKRTTLTEDELNSLIAHAHRRIQQLQQQLAEQQVLEQQRINNALDRQREENEKHTQDLINLERERILGELDVIKQNWESESRLEFEKELRTQLSRQAAAHSDHIVEVLRIQQKELERRNELVTNEKLDEVRGEFNQTIGDSLAKIHGIEMAIDARAELEKRSRKAQEFWLACQTLHTAILNHSAFDEETLHPLAPEIANIKKAGDSHPFVTTVIDSIPEEALNRGVWSDVALAERFLKVSRVGRRVAMIDETGGSLFKYFLSYLQSLFVISMSRQITRDTLVTPGELSTFEILDNATSCMERGDLELAVRLVNQLKGQARQVASDWLIEARLLLETRQAADALLAYATASGLSALF